MVVQTGDATLRKENVSDIVDGFALMNYTLRQVALVSTSNAWKEIYWEEQNYDPVAKGTRNIKGVSRGANFPSIDVDFTEKSNRHLKFAAQTSILWEDALLDDIPIISRKLLRLGRAIARSEDEYIWSIISESQSAVNINSYSIAAGNEWDSTNEAAQNPIKDLLLAKKLIEEDNYDAEGAFLILSPKDYANLLANASVRNAGQFYTSDVTRNGRVGRICGLEIIKSNSVTADYSLIIVPNEACTLKVASPLKTTTEEDFGIKYTIKAFMEEVAFLTNPSAVVLISNTAA